MAFGSAVLLFSILIPNAAQADEARNISHENAVPGVAPKRAENTAIYLDAQGREISNPFGVSTERDSVGCTPDSGRDNPHFSSGDVSGHGRWRRGNCTANTATVYNCLYEYYTDNSWRQKACSPSKQLRPYTGSGDRTVARAKCAATNEPISWRNHVDVDVDNQIDTPEKPFNEADVMCTVF